MNYATKEKQTLTIVGVVSSTWKIVNMFLPLGILFFFKKKIGCLSKRRPFFSKNILFTVFLKYHSAAFVKLYFLEKKVRIYN